MAFAYSEVITVYSAGNPVRLSVPSFQISSRYPEVSAKLLGKAVAPEAMKAVYEA
jgi:hypothetical protein